ncbi:MAG: tRNA dimethylallyltransferase, partial [bacterium]|nr:tRNA dimethylallyltransferase [bacterium]
GLYLRALLEGLDPLPQRDQKIRDRLGGLATQVLHQKLKEVDPKLAERVAPQDRSRLTRFLEIFELSGRPPSALLRRGRASELQYVVETHWLCPAREVLRGKIGERVKEMFARGWVEEVRSLKRKGKDPLSWENKPIGYSEIARNLDAKVDWNEIQEMIIQKTRRYAKRQETFFRGLMKNPAYRQKESTVKVLKFLGNQSDG